MTYTDERLVFRYTLYSVLRSKNINLTIVSSKISLSGTEHFVNDEHCQMRDRSCITQTLHKQPESISLLRDSCGRFKQEFGNYRIHKPALFHFLAKSHSLIHCSSPDRNNSLLIMMTMLFNLNEPRQQSPWERFTRRGPRLPRLPRRAWRPPRSCLRTRAGGRIRGC